MYNTEMSLQQTQGTWHDNTGINNVNLSDVVLGFNSASLSFKGSAVYVNTIDPGFKLLPLGMPARQMGVAMVLFIDGIEVDLYQDIPLNAYGGDGWQYNGTILQSTGLKNIDHELVVQSGLARVLDSTQTQQTTILLDYVIVFSDNGKPEPSSTTVEKGTTSGTTSASDFKTPSTSSTPESADTVKLFQLEIHSELRNGPLSLSPARLINAVLPRSTTQPTARVMEVMSIAMTDVFMDWDQARWSLGLTKTRIAGQVIAKINVCKSEFGESGRGGGPSSSEGYRYGMLRGTGKPIKRRTWAYKVSVQNKFGGTGSNVVCVDIRKKYMRELWSDKQTARVQHAWGPPWKCSDLGSSRELFTVHQLVVGIGEIHLIMQLIDELHLTVLSQITQSIRKTRLGMLPAF
ncbi:hypothetical protein BDV98DRAFT_586769 [Pterulicium gracile]|uniref:Uncharacterized protein n=1 Tax=Pterulicium gracile TaxID=1884261 RepID=A0A5C3QBT1_9AGAR|nr:hypothetical protein BDV98DRAFT_586769 [Pterula gracilis]